MSDIDLTKEDVIEVTDTDTAPAPPPPPAEPQETSVTFSVILRSSDGEEFATFMRSLPEAVKVLEKNNHKNLVAVVTDASGAKYLISPNGNLTRI